MQVPEQVLQVPLEHVLVALGVVQQRRRELLPRGVAVVERVGVEVDDLAGDVVDVAAAVAADVGGLSEQVHGDLQARDAPCYLLARRGALHEAPGPCLPPSTTSAAGPPAGPPPAAIAPR